MKITVTDNAQEWFKNELGISKDRGVRFLGKVYGSSQIHEGFSVALDVDEPKDPIALVTYDDIDYFVESSDDWFFSGYDLEVDLDVKQNEPVYNFHEQSN